MKTDEEEGKRTNAGALISAAHKFFVSSSNNNSSNNSGRYLGIIAARATSSQLLHYCSFVLHASSPMDSNVPGIMCACVFVSVWMDG